MSKCKLAGRKLTIPCDGEFIPPEGLCFRHAALFDVWICDCDGHAYVDRLERREAFVAWLNSMTLEQAERILTS